jgi:hypothetical protein
MFVAVEDVWEGGETQHKRKSLPWLKVSPRKPSYKKGSQIANRRQGARRSQPNNNGHEVRGW